MAMYSERRLVSVPSPATGATFAYGFRTNVAAGSSTALGHTAVTAANLPTTVFGINHPKPRRATRDNGAPNFTETSFIAAGSITAALNDGWKLLSPRRARYTNSARTRVVFVVARTQNEAPLSTQTYNFGWRMPLQQYNLLTAAERTALGIEDYTGSTDNVNFGVTDKRSRPTRVRKRMIVSGDDDAGQMSIVSTFVASNKEDSLPDGWA